MIFEYKKALNRLATDKDSGSKEVEVIWMIFSKNLLDSALEQWGLDKIGIPSKVILQDERFMLLEVIDRLLAGIHQPIGKSATARKAFQERFKQLLLQRANQLI